MTTIESEPQPGMDPDAEAGSLLDAFAAYLENPAGGFSIVFGASVSDGHVPAEEHLEFAGSLGIDSETITNRWSVVLVDPWRMVTLQAHRPSEEEVHYAVQFWPTGIPDVLKNATTVRDQ